MPALGTTVAPAVIVLLTLVNELVEYGRDVETEELMDGRLVVLVLEGMFVRLLEARVELLRLDVVVVTVLDAG